MSIDQLQRARAPLVLERVGGEKQPAASLLGLDRRTLQRWFGEGQGEDEEC